MTPDELRAAAAVMLAAADGAEIEFRDRHTRPQWENAVKTLWDWASFEYRVKTEPRTVWVVINEESGLPHVQSFAHVCRNTAEVQRNKRGGTVVEFREVVK